MKTILVALLLFISIASQAQNIKGYVYADKDKSPVQFASVGLIVLPDTVVSTGAITLTDGAFTFEKLKPGKYNVQVTNLGFTTVKKEVTIQEGDGDILLDTIFLTESLTTLNEATVSAERLKGKEMVDRTVYSIPAVVASSSTNGYDILKKIPQVNVDFQNNITMNGSSNFIIQVDGRQRDREFLAKLLPTDIESVEIITNPSGKYEGNIDGVINIILKKEARYGTSGNVSLSAKPFNKPTVVGSGSIDYSHGKITFYATAFSFSQSLFIFSKVNNNNFTDTSLLNTYGDGNLKINVSSVNTGFDYYMNEHNSVSLNVSYKPSNQILDMQNISDRYKNDLAEMTTTTVIANNQKSDESTISLFYKKTFNKAVQEFSIEANYYKFNSEDLNEYDNNYLVYDGTIILPYYRFENNLNNRAYSSFKLNYVQPLGLSTKLETGYQFYYQDLGYNLKVNAPESDDLFKYSEFRHSVYGGITFNSKKIGLQAVIRFENSHINSDSVTSPNYTCVLPSANLQYKFSPSHNLKLTYNRRITRPGIYDMNPYPRIDQDYNITLGNPDLRPDYRDRLQLTYTWNFGSNYFSPNVYYEFLSDKISPRTTSIPTSVPGLNSQLTKPYNLLNGYEYGGGMTAMLWFININARIFSGHFNEYQSFNIKAKDYFSYSITANAFAPLDKDKKTVLFAFLNYNGVNIDLQTKTYNLTLYGIGGQKTFKNHSAGVVFVLPFSKDIEYTRAETETPELKNQNITGFDVSYYIQFFYSYKFSKGKNVKKVDRKVEVESDTKNKGIGN
jgi:hypothetical protein